WLTRRRGGYRGARERSLGGGRPDGLRRRLVGLVSGGPRVRARARRRRTPRDGRRRPDAQWASGVRAAVRTSHGCWLVDLETEELLEAEGDVPAGEAIHGSPPRAVRTAGAGSRVL